MSGVKRADAGRRWPLSRIVNVAVLALLLFAAATVVIGGIALASTHNAGAALDAAFIGMAIGLLLTVALLALGLRATAIRPLHQLAAQVRRVADGDFEAEVTVRGSREVTSLAADVNTMRERILQELQTPTSPPLGLGRVQHWPGTQVRLDGSWSVLLYTDGLIEGRIGRGSERLGSEGLMELIRRALRAGPPASIGNGEAGAAGPPVDGQLLDRVIGHVRELNGGDLDDDLAILALGYSPGR